MKKVLLGFFIIFLFSSRFVLAQDQIFTLYIKGEIGPATSDYIVRNINKAHEEEAKVIIIEIDTPGGLNSSMREIIQAVLSSSIPVIGYVTPSGARAASAGTLILYACHIAAMSPGTNIGAASPVGFFDAFQSNQDNTTSNRKTTNDVAAYIRSLAQIQNRNAQWAEMAVLSAATLTVTEAFKKGVIDVIAKDQIDLLTKIDGVRINLLGKYRTIKIKQPIFISLDLDWRYKFLSVITSPSVAYILLLMGVYGLFFEFANPGLIIPGVIGGISLLLAMYSLQMLPISYAGLGLLVLGIIFSVAEIFVPSFGALGIGGIIAFIVGSILLFDTQLVAFKLAYPLIIAMLILNILFTVFVIGMFIKSKRRKVVSGKEWLLYQTGVIMNDMEKIGLAKIKGEIWQVLSHIPLKKGEKIKVVSIKGLTLKVQPVKKKTSKKGE